MITDPELNALVETSLATLYNMIACTEGNPLDHIGEVYTSDNGVDGKPTKLVVVGYSDLLALEGQPNGVLSPVLSRFFMVRKVDPATGELQAGSWMLALPAFAKYNLEDERWAVDEPCVVTPSFAVRRCVRTVPDGELDETSFFSIL